MTVSDSAPSTLIDLIAGSPADKTAIILPEPNIRITYGALRAQVEAVAEQLAAAGIGRGDRVGIALPNGLPIDRVVSGRVDGRHGRAAQSRVQGRRVPLLPRRHRRAKVLILPPDGARRSAPRRRRPTCRFSRSTWTPRARSRSPAVAGRAPVAPPSIDDVALVLHTSGSTGRPKRVPLAPRQPVDLGRQRRAALRARPRRCVAVRDAAVSRARPRRLDACDALDRRNGRRPRRNSTRCRSGAIAKDHGVTWYSAVPTLHQLLLARVTDPASRPAGAEQLRFIRSCSASLPPQLMQRARSRVRRAGARGVRHDRSGAPDGVQSAAAGARASPARSAAAPTCASASWTRTGTHLPPGERGEVVIQGPNVIRGYENNPEANAKSFVDGWFRTGDQGYPRRGRLSDARRRASKS